MGAQALGAETKWPRNPSLYPCSQFTFSPSSFLRPQLTSHFLPAPLQRRRLGRLIKFASPRKLPLMSVSPLEWTGNSVRAGTSSALAQCLAEMGGTELGGGREGNFSY